MPRSLVSPVPSGLVAPVANKPSLVTVDTIRLSYPIDDVRRRALGYRTANRVAGYVRHLDKHVSVNILRDQAALEVSLPKYANGHNTTCLDLGQAMGVAHQVYEDFRCLIPWRDDGVSAVFPELVLARIDLVVDFFGVEDSAILLDAIDRNSRCLRIPTVRHANDGESLLLRRRRWSCGLYDKHLETKRLSPRGVHAPKGQLRCEARLRSGRLNTPWADKCGGRVVGLRDLSVELMELMFERTFDEVGFGHPMFSREPFGEAVLGSDLKVMAKAALLGFSQAPELLREASPATASQYRVWAADLAERMPGSSRLDLGTGQLVTAA